MQCRHGDTEVALSFIKRGLHLSNLEWWSQNVAVDVVEKRLYRNGVQRCKTQEIAKRVKQ